MCCLLPEMRSSLGPAERALGDSACSFDVLAGLRSSAPCRLTPCWLVGLGDAPAVQPSRGMRRHRGELVRKAIRSHESLDDDVHCIGATKSASGILNLEHRRSDVAGVVDDLLIVIFCRGNFHVVHRVGFAAGRKCHQPTTTRWAHGGTDPQEVRAITAHRHFNHKRICLCRSAVRPEGR